MSHSPLLARAAYSPPESGSKRHARSGTRYSPSSEVEFGESAVVIEDVVTTGGSSREVVALLKNAGARVLGAGSIIDRSGGSADLGVPRVALKTLAVTVYDPVICPLCREGVAVVKPGSRPVAVH